MDSQLVLSSEAVLLKTGFTTGCCAAAAAKAALVNANSTSVEVTLPGGVVVSIPVLSVSDRGDEGVTAVVVKDSGDDADVTHGIEIHAQVKLTECEGRVEILGGEGVGIVTRKGLQTPVGSHAINPVPLKMIEDNLKPLLPKGCGAKVVIIVPSGRELASKTFNPRLGIEGGISIIGTSGIVRPMSEEAFKDAIYLELSQKYALGIRSVCLVPGMHGEKFAMSKCGIPLECIVHMSNFVGFSLSAAEKLGFESILMVGHIGKFIKLAAGIFHTHSKIADGRAHVLVTHLALAGAPDHLLRQVYHMNTTDEVADVLAESVYFSIFNRIGEEAKEKCLQRLERIGVLDIVMYDMAGRTLTDSRNSIEGGL